MSVAHRVLITGVGVVSPLGCAINKFWDGLLSGDSSITKVPEPGYSTLPSKVAGIVRDDLKVARKERNRISRTAVFAVEATDQALDVANFKPVEMKDTSKIGVLMGNGMVDLSDIYLQWEAFSKQGYSKVSPRFIPKILPNHAAGVIAMKHNITGMVHCVSTACATGAHAIGDAFRLIKAGELDAVIVGASDSSVNPLAIAGFSRMRALSTSFNDEPSKASRPFDTQRDGFVLSEGAAVLLLEAENFAKQRGAPDIFGEVVGYGYSSDAHHISAPPPDGKGAMKAMENALLSASVGSGDISYISAHATSTPQGDVAEASAICSLFGSKIPFVSSIKGSLGHLLGAAGAIESVATVLALYHKVMPGNTNLFEKDLSLPLNFHTKLLSHGTATPLPTKASRHFALNNSFGFFGANASLCFAEVLYLLMDVPGETTEEPIQQSNGPMSSSPSKGLRKSFSPVQATEFKLGDVVWAHVNHYPWWPAIIAADPKDEKEQHKMTTTTFKGTTVTSFHVMFFGPSPEHNWITVRHLMPYTGKADFDKYMADLKEESKSKANRAYFKSLQVKPSQQSAWDSALRECDEAAGEINRDGRLAKCVDMFYDKAAKRVGRTPKKAEPAEGAEGGEVTKSAKRKKKAVSPKQEAIEVDEAKTIDSIQSAATPGLDRRDSLPQVKPKRPKKKTPITWNSTANDELHAMLQVPSEQLSENDPELHPEAAFHVFIQRHLRSVAMRYPTLSYTHLKTLMHSMWIKLSLAEKRKALTAPNTIPEPAVATEMTSRSKANKSVAVDDEDADKPPLPTSLPSQVEEYTEALGQYQLEVYRLTNVWAVRNQPVCGLCEKPGADMSETGSQTPFASPPPLSANTGASAVVEEELLPCSGGCCRHFHKRCISKMNEAFGITEPSALTQSSSVTCAECSTGRRTCFSCKKQDLSQNAENNVEEYSEDDKQMIVCSQKSCGRFYHKICAGKLRLSRFENNSFICPQHACATCAAVVEDPTSAESSRSGRMFRCIRCPVAYHVGDFCIAAGTHMLGVGPNIICGDHYEPTASLAMLTSGTMANKIAIVSKPQNVFWCFTCGKSGPLPEDKQSTNNAGNEQATDNTTAQQQPGATVQPVQGPPEKPLICCATCPAAYHRRCLPAAQAASSDARFICADCSAGKRPLYGDIVWVKVGHYRWWPCEIYHPENLPPNIRKMKHGAGEFAVRFFGTGEFFWLGRGRCFHFQHGDTSFASTSGHGTLARSYNNSIIEGTAAYDEWIRFKERQMGTQRLKANYKPVPFKYIKSNYPIGTVEIPRVDLSEVPKCDCDINEPNPCSSDSTCVNRLTLVECHPQVCNAGDQCCNQRFVKRLYAPAEPFRTGNRGWGLRALAPIRRGQFVVEYIGDLIDDEEHRSRVEEATRVGEKNFYFLSLDQRRIIDAGPKGNLSRFMNHSCDPSCETQKWLVNGDLRVGVFALRDIAAGDELTFNYNCDESKEDAILLDKQPCRCGAPGCRGLIGASKSNNAKEASKKDGSTKANRRSRQFQALQAFRQSHDDECFQCYEPGRLVLCDKPRCPKAYHVGCLGQDKPPSGRFICPWHHCSVCWKPSVQLCAFCPHSYCAEHVKPENITSRYSVSMGPVWCCHGHDPKELDEALSAPDQS